MAASGRSGVRVASPGLVQRLVCGRGLDNVLQVWLYGRVVVSTLVDPDIHRGSGLGQPVLWL